MYKNKGKFLNLPDCYLILEVSNEDIVIYLYVKSDEDCCKSDTLILNNNKDDSPLDNSNSELY